MLTHRQRATRVISPWAAPLILLLFGAAGCGEQTGLIPRNHPPQVRLTGGPANGDSAAFDATFLWHGWDDDGIVASYRYGLVNLIDHPEVTGPADIPPEGWRDTLSTRASFELRSPQSTDEDGDEPTQFSLGRHLFAVQAIDDAGDSSTVDWLVVTSRNIVPRTTIDYPKIPVESGLVQFREGVEIRWSGVDSDSPDPGRKPVAYEWKVVPLAPSTPGFTVNVHYAVTNTPGPQYPWNRVDGTVRSVRLNLQAGQDYVFAVRGIDLVGGVEDLFVKGQNAIPFSVSSIDLFRPYLTLREPLLGQFTFPADGPVWEVEAPMSRCLRFELTGDASNYGGAISAYNWCVDPPDGGQEEECRGWTGIRTTESICFTEPGLHTIVLKVRDTAGAVTTGLLLVRAIPVVRDRPVLYVDDFRVARRGSVLDADCDRRMLSMLGDAGYAPEDIYQWHTFGEDDREIVPALPRLSELTTYKLLVWSVSGAGFNGNPGLLLVSSCPGARVLRSYMDDGGQVWISGQNAFSALMGQAGSVSRCGSDFSYSESIGLFPGPDHFVCAYLGLCGCDIRTVRDRYMMDGLVRALPTAEAIREGFPDVWLDSTLTHPNLSGLIGSDAVFQPTFDATGGLDTLYTSSPTASNSRFRGRPVAFRYFDPDPGARTGAIAIMGFPPHLMKPGSVAAGTGTSTLASRLIDWFRRNERAVIR
ncbi:MAG: hypothetical protein SGI90_11245 [Candidatus Eisenbacteria bacterium]|nr:hypothetical protein [Candidatus Eisenbacteria bacterium]